MKKIFIFCIVVLMSLISTMFVACSDGGDGKSSCLNCGRKSVYALGYCKTCYKGFIDFTYGD